MTLNPAEWWTGRLDRKELMENYIVWFVLAVILVGLEMATGTFYMLVIAIGMAAGGLAALAGAGLVWQLVTGALVGIAGTVILRHWKGKQPALVANDSFDIGQPVRIVKWNDNGSVRVFYRGAEWDAELESADIPRDATLYIAAVRGSALLLSQHKPQ